VEVPPDLDSFLSRVRPRLVAAMELYLGDRYVAEEIVQEACVRAASRWSKVGALDSPGAWTYRVARNLATSSLRRQQAERRARNRLGDADVDPGPDSAAQLAVRAALAKLPNAQREAVVLKYFLGLDGPEIAERTGRSHDAVRALIKRGIAALREDLDFTVEEATSDVS
jgi:RNA polymerase sigma-70 factor (ECF subfamily)